MLEYKGFKIAGRLHSDVHGRVRVLGFGLQAGRNDSVIEVARIKGKIFDTMKEAEAHGLELAREWVDNLRKSIVSFR